MPVAGCQTLTGWGSGAYGFAPWGGGGGGFAPGGPLPSALPFDVYCVCDNAMQFLDSYAGVTYSPPGAPYFAVDIVPSDLVLTSNDLTDTFLYLNPLPIGSDYTLEFVVKFNAIPINFATPGASQIFVGVKDPSGNAAGLFFSQIGVAYAGTNQSIPQVIPGSSTWAPVPGNYYVCRIAVNSVVGAVFVYFTEFTQAVNTGQVLQAILPVIPSSSTPLVVPGGTSIHVIGTPVDPSQMNIDSICLASSFIVPSLPPVADAGPDQAIRTCRILQLDGTASFDPQSLPLSYFWKLIDAPLGSQYLFEGTDGITIPLLVPTGFTDVFYSSVFGGLDPIPATPGDMLVVGGKVYEILSINPLGFPGPYAQVTTSTIPDNLVNVSFKVLTQNGMNLPFSAKPTFYPDVPGFYKFQLIVSNGQLFSSPSITAVNVLQSVLPRGCTPDLKFIWDYLSDFWRLVEDRERIETVWSVFNQTAATELVTLWQTEYSKSLRDIQRQFNRRWLHYDLLLREPFVELARIRTVWSGVTSTDLANAGVNVAGQTLVLSIPFFDAPVSVTLAGPNPVTPAAIAKQLNTLLKAIDKRFNCTVVVGEPGPLLPVPPTTSRIVVYAPFAFTVVAGTSAPFTLGDTSVPLTGTGGAATSTKTYKTAISLAGLDIRENDFLVIENFPNENYCVRIAGVVDDPLDNLRYQRINLKDPIPLTAGMDWSIPMKVTSSQLDFYHGLTARGDFGIIEVFDQAVQGTAYVAVNHKGVLADEPNSIALKVDPLLQTYFGRYPDRFEIYFWGVYRRHYMPIEELIVDIPFLQRVIKKSPENEVLRRNVDFFLETYRGKTCIRFVEGVFIGGNRIPVKLVPRLWAEYTYLDNRPTIESNFGIAVDFTLDDLSKLPSNFDYLSAVQGLWYAYLNGPTVFNMRAGSQILLGLPFAEEDSIIYDIKVDFSPNKGRILLQDKTNPELIRSYSFPKALPLEVNPATGKVYAVGDTVKQFAPLVTGVGVIDYIKDPTWFQGMMGQGLMYEVEKFHRFMVRVQSAAFNLPSLLFTKNFILRIKPAYTYPIFLVELDLKDTDVDVSDELSYKGFLSLFELSWSEFLYDPLAAKVGSATMVDQPDPSPGVMVAPGGPVTAPAGLLSGHIVNALDTGSDPTQPYPTYPTFYVDATWGMDRQFIRPETLSYGVVSMVYAGGPMVFDNAIFVFDQFILSGERHVWGMKFLTGIPVAGHQLRDDGPILVAIPVTGIMIYLKGIPTAGSTNMRLQVTVNAVLQADLPFVHNMDGQGIAWGPPPSPQPLPAPFTINPGDTVDVRIVPDGLNPLKPFLHSVLVTIGEAVGWWFDMGLPGGPPALPAGTYYRVIDI